MGGFTILVIALLVFAVVTVAFAVKAVPQGYEYTVERFGRYTTTLGPGLHIITPLLDRLGVKITTLPGIYRTCRPAFPSRINDMR